MRLCPKRPELSSGGHDHCHRYLSGDHHKHLWARSGAMRTVEPSSLLGLFFSLVTSAGAIFRRFTSAPIVAYLRIAFDIRPYYYYLLFCLWYLTSSGPTQFYPSRVSYCFTFFTLIALLVNLYTRLLYF